MIAFNVAQLLKEPPGTTRKLAFSEPPAGFDSAVELGAPVEGRVRLLRTSRGILASTEYRTSIRQECGRCLDPTLVEIRGVSEDEFQPRVDVTTGLTLLDQPESAELAIDERHVLDLTEVVRQDILTRLPLQPLCEPDCPGLCTECGWDLRAGACTCGRQIERDSPFAELAKFLDGNGAERGSS